jgi:hypothetical protein
LTNLNKIKIQNKVEEIEIYNKLKNQIKMLKALVFLSVIINLAYSAPYGGYGGNFAHMESSNAGRASSGGLAVSAYSVPAPAPAIVHIESSNAGQASSGGLVQPAYYAPAPAVAASHMESSNAAQASSGGLVESAYSAPAPAPAIVHIESSNAGQALGAAHSSY